MRLRLFTFIISARRGPLWSLAPGGKKPSYATEDNNFFKSLIFTKTVPPNVMSFLLVHC